MKSPRVKARYYFAGAVCLLAGLMVPATPARATPRPLPFTYPYETLPSGALELEQYVDMVPMRVVRENESGSDAVTSVRYNLETEAEYALTDHIEAAWYFVFRQGASASTPAMRFMGVKQRVRFRFAETGELPIDLGLYLEVAEFHNEFEFEEKLILARRFGALSLHANLWVEQEYYFQDEEWRHLYNPTAGLAYQIVPSFVVGLEYWARGRFDEAQPDSTGEGEAEVEATSGPHHYAGPTLMVQSEQGFASLGTYVRWDDLGESAKPDDPWGKVWVRVLFGVDL
ncbi:MAG TPA: hypothetical protein VFU02_00400 [Polyangiaceae bacterium]|nr:hypothetical protein [Polyangiaceae bacterium]